MDQLIAGFVATAATLSTIALTSFLGRAWRWWDNRQAMRGELRRFRTLIEITEATTALSRILMQMKEYALSHDQVLERPRVKQFFDTWLKDVMLDVAGTHTKLMNIGCEGEMAQLKRDAASLIQW